MVGVADFFAPVAETRARAVCYYHAFLSNPTQRMFPLRLVAYL